LTSPLAINCDQGEVSWQTLQGQVGRAVLDVVQTSDQLRFDLDADGVGLSGRWLFSAKAFEQLTLNLNEFDLGRLLPVISPWVDLNVLDGQIDARLTLQSAELDGEWQIDGGGFDGNDGQIAGDGLQLAGRVSGRIDAKQQSLDLSLTQSKGELLIGPLYLPTPSVPIETELKIVREAADSIHIDRVRYVHPGVVQLMAEARLMRREGFWQVTELGLFDLEADLEQAWPRWVDGLAASAGFAGLSVQGELSASARMIEGRFDGLDATVEGFELTDPRGRFDLGSTRARIHRDPEGIHLALDLEGLMLYGLPFGATTVRVSETDRGWILQAPLRLPLLDGAVVVDRFELDPDEEAPGLTLDARIEPLSLEELTGTLDWPQFGGELSGEFPGIEYRNDRLDVTGGINVNAFSGQIQLTDLVVERPFGTLPALAAQVEINRLDLLELTGAFNFGRMEGRLSGWMRDLRLLNWQPVAMDTRLFTHDDVPRRRISQRAVDNLSNLGGGFGGALIGNTVLSIFEDFPYRRAGLACRLSNNVCYIDGVGAHESGGFYIVEGRGLPHLDIIGHRRLVDWPQLVEQLTEATR